MHIDDIDTPAVVIDLAKVETNLQKAQDYSEAHALPLRPHVKTHKLPRFALAQMALGAIGITAQKLGEAEAMANGGLSDIFLPYNILGAAKLDRLFALNYRVTLSVTADSLVTISGYANRFSDPQHPLVVLIECDTGADRCGVQTADEALILARAIAAAKGLKFGGLMTYPARGGLARTEAWLITAIDILTRDGLAPPVVSSGGTPDFKQAATVTTATEHRPGTYIYNDRMQVAWGHCTLDDCALTVLATVVSRPTSDRAVLDSGSKALAADQCPSPGYGHIILYPDAVISGLSEEHAVVDLSACATRPEIGDRVRVIPNHACVVSNLYDVVHLMRDDQVDEIAAITSRGKLT
ncbi:MAG: D-serine deaminase-like pyridoxal phosphate-dependent protein [Paracoccaceae bacterium]|jgi:D-serine deaminase-like pyridoxal phosphate-dependent protein